MVKESVVQRKLLDRLDEVFGGSYIRKIHQTMYSHNGIPDLIGSINGHFVGIEVKKTSGKLSKLQMIELEKITLAGGTALTCYGLKGIDDVIRILRKKTI